MWSGDSVMKISKIPVVWCLLILIVSLTGCSGLTRSDQPATKTWWLEPYAGMAHEASPGAPKLVAISVTVVPGLDTDRILTLSEDAQLNHFATARWADNLPELAASLIGRSLEASGRFEMLSDRTGGGSENCSLQLEVREFFANLGPSGQVNGVGVAADGYYQCESNEPLALHLSASIPVYDDRMSVIVAAFQQALDSVMKDLPGQLQEFADSSRDAGNFP